MIIRVFRVLIHPQHKLDFEKAYNEISVPLVKSQKGLISVETGYPITGKSLEYVMVSNWESITALQNFAGDNWLKAVIPGGMEKHIERCWVHHYELNQSE